MNVLIAEDDAASRLILQRSVERLGHECHAARDGAEAWTLFETLEPDVIISDWMMPEIDGVDLCRRVRSYSGGTRSYTYFIVATALADREHFLTAMEQGADDYLTKPLDRVELRVRLNVAARVMTLYRELETRRAELEALSGRYYEQARQDPLTRLGNRLRLREDLEILDARLERYDHRYSVILCDVDHFKLYNDRYGHQAGDEVLRSVGHALQGNARAGDSAYRYGGEEFLVVLPQQDLEAAVAAANRLRRVIEDLALPHEASPAGVVTVSMGVAAAGPGERQRTESLLGEADAALYEAKESGRNRVIAHIRTAT